MNGVYSEGQPVMNVRSGVVSWVMVAGVEEMTVQYAHGPRRRVRTANYAPAHPLVPWATMPQATYGSTVGGWSS